MANETTIKPELRKKIVSAQAIRELAREGFLFELPSGFVVRMVAADIAILFRKGGVSNDLIPLMIELMATDRIDPHRFIEKASESMESMIELIDLVCCASLREPRCVMPDYNSVTIKGVNGDGSHRIEPSSPPPDDAIWPEHLSLEDRQAIFAAANAPSEALRSFRHKQSRTVESGSDGQALRSAAEPTAAD